MAELADAIVQTGRSILEGSLSDPDPDSSTLNPQPYNPITLNPITL